MSVPSISYTDRDFDTIKEALKVHIQSKFPNTWRDFYESQMGIAWLELCAYCFDVLSFYLDYQANESYISTARDRLSIIRLGELVGYSLRPPTAAGVVVGATIDAAQAQDVVIASGTTISSTSGVTFRTLIEQRITAGSTTADITFTEGEQQTDNFTSDGSAFQEFKLTESGVVSGSITVTVDGVEWSSSDSLVYGTGTSRIYSVRYDEDDYGFIRFGDGTSGMIPPNGSSIQVVYRVGGGVDGNIAVGQINTTVQGQLDGVVPASYVTVSLYNAQRGSGGEARETEDHARYWIPRWVKTNQRAVTEEDFDTLATAYVSPTFGSVAYAKAKLHQEIPELNQVDIYVWGRDSGGNIVAASTGLKSALESYFMNNDEGAIRVICTDVDVLDGTIIYLDIEVQITLLSNYAASDVTSGVTTALDTLIENLEPNHDVNLSQVYNAIHDVAGVNHALVVNIYGSLKSTETVGVGDGATANYTGTLLLEPNLPVTPHSCVITDGTQTVIDDGNGNLIGNVAAAGTNTIDYESGAFDVTFAANVAAGASVSFEYKYAADYQRGESEATGDGSTKRFTGAVEYPPVVEYDAVTGQKGIAFTDGSQVVVDDGDGNLTGDVDASGNNHFDYDTGAYDFTFALAPAVGATIQSTYRQLLRTPSENLPIDKTQLAVKNRYAFTTTTS
jgi:hypothetical protein